MIHWKHLEMKIRQYRNKNSYVDIYIVISMFCEYKR